MSRALRDQTRELISSVQEQLKNQRRRKPSARLLLREATDADR